VEFAQEQAERFLSGAIGLRYGAEIDVRLFDRAFSSGAINFLFPRAWRTTPAFHHDGEIEVIRG
jgi:hypothetical protein